MDKKKLVPEVRFSGFNDEWVPKKLDDLVIQIRSYPISRRFESQEKTSLKYIHYGDIHTGVAKKVKNDSSIPYIKPGEYELLQQGDFVVADASEDYKGIAAPCIIVDKPNNGLVAGLHTIAMRPIKVDPYFLFNLFNTEIFEKFGQVMGTGIKVFGITYTNLSRFIANLPELEEQEKIGALFEKIDNAIELQEKLVEENKNFKKSMLQKMFPKKGKDIPEIRFSKFTDRWINTKLGNIGEISSAGVNKKIYKDEEETFLLNYMDVYNKKKINSNNLKTLMKVTASEIQLEEKNVKKGDIFFTPSSETREDMGHSMVIEEDFENLVYSYHIIRFRPKKNYLDLYFSNYFANIEPVRRQLIMSAQGAQRFTIRLAEFNNLIIKIPPLPEQKAIGLFFKSLDKKIELEEKKLENYKTLKKALLQKMFI